MNGTWEFRMDPKDQGAAQHWFSANAEYPDKILVPGCWQAQGFGEPRGHLRHDYQGKAWYRKTIKVPADWSGKRIWVHIGAASNTADVYVNGKKVGHVEEFLTPWEFDATESVKPGEENVIACCVDSTGLAPIGMFNFTGRWGGLNREVFLEARRDPQVENIFIIPDVKNKTARTRVALRRHAANASWLGQVDLTIRPADGSGKPLKGQGKVRFAAGKQESEPLTVDIEIPNVRCWSPDDPYLYTIDVALVENDKVIDNVQDRFGMRQFEVGQGGVLLLNGKPFFVRGLGDDSVEVMTGIPFPDKQIYIDRLKMAKRYGFNGIRFLSHTPNKEYFDAADEVGMLLLCDGELYKRLKEPLPIMKKQVARLVKTHCNHPCWYAFSSANELFQCQGANPDADFMDYIHYAHKTFKSLDPTRFFIGTEGADVFPSDIITKADKFSGPPMSPDQPFEGLIDEVAYFKKALSDQQMAGLAVSSGAVAYPATVKSLQPSAYWRFEEDKPERALDSSGNNRHGTYDATMTAAELKQPGVLEPESASRAIRVGSNHKGVHLEDVAKETFAAGNKPFSISLWVKPSGCARGDFGTPFAYGAAQNRAALLIAEDGKDGLGQLRLGRYMDDFLISGAAIRPGNWNHIGITYDGSILKLFLNGKLDKSAKVKLTTAPLDGRIGASVARSSSGGSSREDARLKYSSRPHIWHEFPNTYVGPLPNLTVMDKWTGVYRDDHCISYHRKQIAELGINEKYPNARQRSIDLFYLYLKDHYERARHSQTMDGYNYWCFTDFPGGPEGDMTTYGIFSTLYEPEKFPEPDPIRQFNRETVLLIHAGVGTRVLRADKPRSVALGVSHYGPEPIRNGLLRWTATAGEKVIQEGTIGPVDAQTGQVKQLGTVTLGPYKLDKAERVRLSVKLESEVCRQHNHWDFWAFPDRGANVDFQGVVNITGVDALNARYGIAPGASLDNARLAITDRLTPELIAYLENGGRVLLCGEKGIAARSHSFSFWPRWIRSTGTVIEKHPSLEGFPHDGFCAYQFIRLFDPPLASLNLNEKGSGEREKLTPIIWGLSQDPAPRPGTQWHSMANRWKINRHGVLCEGRCGKGKLLVCNLRLLRGIEPQQPEAGYLLDMLVAYALSEKFEPTAPPMSADELRKVFPETKKTLTK